MVKLKEEFDYKSLARRLDIQLDKLSMEHERQQKAFEDELERLNTEAKRQISEAEKRYTDALEVFSLSILSVNLYHRFICVSFYVKQFNCHYHAVTLSLVLFIHSITCSL